MQTVNTKGVTASIRDVCEEMKRAQADDWTVRVVGARKLRWLLLQQSSDSVSAMKTDVWNEGAMCDALTACIADLRSQACRDGCVTLA